MQKNKKRTIFFVTFAIMLISLCIHYLNIYSAKATNFSEYGKDRLIKYPEYSNPVPKTTDNTILVSTMEKYVSHNKYTGEVNPCDAYRVKYQVLPDKDVSQNLKITGLNHINFDISNSNLTGNTLLNLLKAKVNPYCDDENYDTHILLGSPKNLKSVGDLDLSNIYGVFDISLSNLDINVLNVDTSVGSLNLYNCKIKRINYVKIVNDGQCLSLNDSEVDNISFSSKMGSVILSNSKINNVSNYPDYVETFNYNDSSKLNKSITDKIQSVTDCRDLNEIYDKAYRLPKRTI